MASENFDQQRLKDLEDNLARERELLKQFEETLSYATKPREIAELKREIKRQNQAIDNYQQEYNSLKKKQTNATSAPNTIQNIEQPAAQIEVNNNQTENSIPRIFICYAHRDNESSNPSKRWLNRLLEQLNPLHLQEQADIWSDEQIELGERWHDNIQGTLEQVKAAILLVSPAFLASEYIRNSEVPVLLKNAQDRGALIIPIILRKCLFRETTFKFPNAQTGPQELSLSVFQAPTTNPLNSLREHEQDEVLYNVAQRIFQIVNPPDT